MNRIAKILLFIFITFLITPTIVYIIENDMDTSELFSSAEEEKTVKDFKIILYHHHFFDESCLLNKISSTTSPKNSLRYDDVALGIFIPPPETIRS